MSDLSCNTEHSEEPTPFSALIESVAAIADAHAEPEPPLREGLPAGYRMRADAHYIEQLDAPPTTPVQSIPVRAIDGADEAWERPIPALVDSIKRYGVLEPLLVQKRDGRYRLITGRKRLTAARAGGLLDVPCLVHRVSDDEARRIAAAAGIAREQVFAADEQGLTKAEDEIERSLSAILGCTPLLNDALPALTRSVALDMLATEAHRATCALAVVRVIREGVAAARRPASAREVVDRVVSRVSPDLRLRGMAIHATTGAGTFDGDAELLACTMASVVFQLSAALDRGNGARLSVIAVREGRGPWTIALEQEAVILPDTWVTLASDGAVEPVASDLLPLLALRRVAEAYGGRLVASRLRRASRIAIELPASDD